MEQEKKIKGGGIGKICQAFRRYLIQDEVVDLSDENVWQI